MIKIDWKYVLCLLLAALIFAGCTTPPATSTNPAQPPAAETPNSKPAETTAAPTATPKPMQSTSVTADGTVVVLESESERYEITFHLGDGKTTFNDATIERFIKWSARNVEKQDSNDMMACNMINWALGPYLAGDKYTSACYRLWYHEPETILVKTFPAPDSRMEVSYTDAFTLK